MAGGLVEGLTAAISELADVDLEGLDDAELHHSVSAIGGLATRLDAIWCRLIGAWDRRQSWAADGSKSPAARLARETHRRRSECDRLVRRARDLQTMPATEAAYAAGELSGSHVDLVASCNRQWRNADFTDSEEFLVGLCRTPFFNVAHHSIEYWKQLADRDAADRDAEAARAGRHLSASVGWRGEVLLKGVLDPLGGETFKTELDRICRQTASAGRPPSAVPMPSSRWPCGRPPHPPTGYARDRC
jgi:hypothetical protein